MKSNKYELFGRSIIHWIMDQDNFHHEEMSEDLMNIGLSCGVVKKEIFDPDLHGDYACAEYLEEGDEFWTYDRPPNET